MSSVSESNLEKKFQHVTNTQEGIQSFSLWIIHHKSHCKKIVDVWMKTVRKTKVSHRLTLLYLANDVIQNAKRKGAAQFAEAFYSVLPEATVLLRDDKIRGSVERVFNIWENRSIFDTDAIDELKRILNNAEESNKATTKLISEFKPELLNEKIRKAVKLQLETTSKLSALNASKLDAANSEVLRQFKDRSHGQQFSKDFEEATRCLEEYIGALEREVAERAETIQLLEQAVVYYDTQRGEARIVSNAYKSFSSRITIQKKKLDELKAKLPSPFPSPCADAPSPTNSDEGLDLAAESAVAAIAAAAVTAAASAGVPELLDDVPSPVGTPEGLQLSPKIEENAFATKKPPSEDLGLFLPIVSSTPSMPVTSFLGTQGAGLMSSWLDAFNTPVQNNTSEQKTLDEVKADDSLDSRLDSRLFNLMQSMPSSVPSALLAGVGGETPVKDEWASAQGTPVQDEDEPPQNDLLKQLSRYSTNSPSQGHWPSVLPPNPVSVPSPALSDDVTEIKPLEPPPKPSFAFFGQLASPPPTTTAAKGKTDPRLTSQNYSTANANNSKNIKNHHKHVTSSITTTTTTTTTTSKSTGEASPTATVGGHTGRDDIEPMDMDIGESDDDEDKHPKSESRKVGAEITGRENLSVGNHILHSDDSKKHNNEDVVKSQLTDGEKSNLESALEEKPKSYSTYHHYSYNRMADSRLPDNIMAEDSLPETNLQEKEIVEDVGSRIVEDDVPSNDVVVENRRPESALSENREMESRLTDNRISQSSLLDIRITENRVPDNIIHDDRMIETVLSNNKVHENRMMSPGLPDSRVQDNRMPENNNKTSSTWISDEVECSHIETIQSTRNDDWRSPPPWDDGSPLGYAYRPPHQHHYRPHMQQFDERRPYDRPYNELGYGRGYPPPMLGPKRFPPPFGGRGGRGYFVPRY